MKTLKLLIKYILDGDKPTTNRLNKEKLACKVSNINTKEKTLRSSGRL